MRYSLLLLFTLAYLRGFSQNSLIQKNDSLKAMMISNKTAIGNLVGNKSSKLIGPGGGTIIAADSVVQLIIPPGALDANTAISVQPAVNMSSGSIGYAYDFEPSGLHFLKPAKLVFNYSDSESKKHNPVLQNIAWQDKDGQWQNLEKIAIDSISKTISGDISHFSQFARKAGFRLSFDFEKDHVKTPDLMFVITDLIPDSYGPINKSNRNHVIEDFCDNQKFRWYVNDIENGDAVNGKISFKGYPPNGISAFYIAPPVPPPDNPVKITVQMDGPITLNNGMILGSVATNSYIEVIPDQYRFTFIHIDENGCFF